MPPNPAEDDRSLHTCESKTDACGSADHLSWHTRKSAKLAIQVGIHTNLHTPGDLGEGVHECASKSASMMAVVVHLTVTAALLSPVHPGQQPWSRPSGGLGRSKFSLHLAVDGGAGGPGGGITGGGGGDDENSDDTNDVASMVAGRGLDFEALPGDMVNALRAGRIGDAELANWAKVLTNPLTRAMAASGFLRARLLSDPRLTSVLGIEVAQGVFSTLAAEKAARGKRFMKEIDFVIANQVSFNAAPPLL